MRIGDVIIFGNVKAICIYSRPYGRLKAFICCDGVFKSYAENIYGFRGVVYICSNVSGHLCRNVAGYYFIVCGMNENYCRSFEKNVQNVMHVVLILTISRHEGRGQGRFLRIV